MNNKTDLIVKDWYIQEYPDDELGVEIKDKITFEDLHKALQNGDDVYDFLGDVDSIVRERCFDKLAQLLGKDYDYIYRLWLDNGDSDFMNEHIVKKSLKESTELDRQAFVSLVKLGDKPYDGYSILNDGNFVKRLYADSDEDAISQFRDWIGRGGTRLKESAKLTEDTSYTRQQLIDAVKNAYGFTNKEALAWIKKASDEAKREVVNGFRQNARKNFYDESLKESTTLTERAWRYTLRNGAKLRNAIDLEDGEGIRTALLACYKELLDNEFIDEYDYDDWTEEIRDADWEDEYGDLDDDAIDFELDQLYDLCDNIDVFVALDDDDEDISWNFKESLKEATTPEQRARRRGKLTTPYDTTYTLSLKNRYNYTVIQYRVDTKNKTIEKGMFNWGDGKGSFFDNRKELQRHIDDLLAQGYKMIESKDESLKEAKENFDGMTIEEIFWKVAGHKFPVFKKDGTLTKQAEHLYGKAAKAYGEDAFDKLCADEHCFKESLKEDWYIFEYESGANPYIAKSEKERDRIIRKYQDRVEDLGNGKYIIHDREEDLFSVDESIVGKTVSNDGKSLGRKLRREFGKGELTGGDNFRFNYQPRRGARKSIQTEPVDDDQTKIKVTGVVNEDDVDESLKEDTKAPRALVKVGPALPRNWVIAKFGNKFALMSGREFDKAKEDPEKWFGEMMIELFPSKKELIKAFKREPAYKSIFDGIEVNESLKESKQASYTVGGYEGKDDPMAKKDIAKAARYDVDADMEQLDDGSWELVITGDVDKVKDYVDNYLGLDSTGLDESLKEDTVKQGNSWVNKGKEGTHGKFKTKRAADAQRKAMFANGYKESLKESADDTKALIDFLKSLKLDDEVEEKVIGDWTVNAWTTEPILNFSRGFYIVQIDNDKLNKHFSISDCISQKDFEYERDRVIKNKLGKSLKESADDDVLYIATSTRGNDVKVFSSLDARYKHSEDNTGWQYWEVPKKEFKSLAKQMNRNFAFNRLHQEGKTKVSESLKEAKNDYVGKSFDDVSKQIRSLGYKEDKDNRQKDADRDVYTYWKGKSNLISVYVKNNKVDEIRGNLIEEAFNTDFNDKKVRKDVIGWWDAVEQWNADHNYPYDIDNGDKSDVEAMHAAMFDMLIALRDEQKDSDEAKALVKDGKRVYNKYSVSRFESLDTEKVEEGVGATVASMVAGKAIETLGDMANQIIDDNSFKGESVEEEKKQTPKEKYLAKRAKLKEESDCSEPKEKPEFLHKGDWVWDDVACDWYDNDSGDYHLELVHNSELPLGDSDEDIQAVFGLKESADWTSDEILAIVDKLNADGIATTANKGIADAYAANENPYRRFEVSKADDKDEWTIKVVWKDDTFESDDTVEESLENVPIITNIFANYNID